MTRRWLLGGLTIAILATGCHPSVKTSVRRTNTGGGTTATNTSQTGGVEIPAQGQIAGVFRIAGGPYPGTSHPIQGTIQVRVGSRTGRLLTTTTAGSNGRFSVNMVAGRYWLVGVTPQITGPGGGCPARRAVVVRDGHISKSNVTCDVP